MNENIGKTAADKVVQSKIQDVEEILNRRFPDYINFDNGAFAITRGSSQVLIVVRPFIKGETAVEFTSNVVVGAKIDENLMKFLLRKNAELHFGAFGLLFDDTITFAYSIAASNLDENEFVNALNSVAYISDYYDDEIVTIAGGKRASDLQEIEED